MGRGAEVKETHKTCVVGKRGLGLEMLSPEIILHFNYFEFLVDRFEIFPKSLKFLKMEF